MTDADGTLSRADIGIEDGPSPILKHRSENRVTRELKHVALKGCDEQLQTLAQCSRDRLFSVVWACRKQNKAVNECLTEFSKNEALRDKLRREHAQRYPDSVTGYRDTDNDQHATREN